MIWLRTVKSLEKKFETNLEMKHKYAESIRNDVEKGYVKKLSEAEVQSKTGKVIWYLSYRYVVKSQEMRSS